MFQPCLYWLHHQTLAQDKTDLSKKTIKTDTINDKVFRLISHLF